VWRSVKSASYAWPQCLREQKVGGSNPLGRTTNPLDSIALFSKARPAPPNTPPNRNCFRKFTEASRRQAEHWSQWSGRFPRPSPPRRSVRFRGCRACTSRSSPALNAAVEPAHLGGPTIWRSYQVQYESGVSSICSGVELGTRSFLFATVAEFESGGSSNPPSD
jgi:hypothetical protein